MDDDFVAWLRHQVDEDELVARAAVEGPWVVGTTSGKVCGPMGSGRTGGNEMRFEDGKIWPQAYTMRGSHVAGTSTSSNPGGQVASLEGWCPDAYREGTAEHIARWDPARVLRGEVEIKRQILDDHAGPSDSPYVADYCEADGWCRDPNDSDLRERMPCRYVRLLALPYADRPGYREEWRP